MTTARALSRPVIGPRPIIVDAMRAADQCIHCGARGYSVGAENLRQYLSAVARYRFLGMFEAKVTQSFNIEMRQAADGTNPTRREKLTLSGLLALHRQVRGLQLDASFERTSSNTEEDYWTIDASVEKQFN